MSQQQHTILIVEDSPEDQELYRRYLLGEYGCVSQNCAMPVIAQYKEFPWAAVAGQWISAQLEAIFDDRYFMASSQLNLLNTILLVDEAD